MNSSTVAVSCLNVDVAAVDHSFYHCLNAVIVSCQLKYTGVNDQIAFIGIFLIGCLQCITAGIDCDCRIKDIKIIFADDAIILRCDRDIRIQYIQIVF